VLIEPGAGAANLATFSIVNCAGNPAIQALNKTYTVEGKVQLTPDGATLNVDHTGSTAQGTLKLNGLAAGIFGTVTISGRANDTEGYTPLSPTTVIT